MSTRISPGCDDILAARDRMRDASLPLSERFTVDFVDHDAADGQPTGGGGIAWFWNEFATSFPDYVRDDVETIVAPDTVTTISVLSGTHTGPWHGHAATGNTFRVRSVQVICFRGGRASDRWGSTDELGLAAQLGLTS